jgi:hypothetical protein
MKGQVLKLGWAASGLPITIPDNQLLAQPLCFIRKLGQYGLVVEQELNNQATYDDRCHKFVPAAGSEHERYRCDGG